MRFAALGLFTAAAVLGAPLGGATGAPVPKHLMKGDPNLAALQGEWRLAEIALGGKPLGADVLGQVELTLEVRGTTFMMTAAKQNLRTTSTIKIDATTDPRRLTSSGGRATDLKGEPAKNAGAEQAGTMLYKIEGDKLVLASNNTDRNQAPQSFNDTGVVSLTFTRVQK